MTFLRASQTYLEYRTCATPHITLEHMASQKGVQRKLKSGPCLGILELGDKGLVKNLPLRWGPEKLKLFWRQKLISRLEKIYIFSRYLISRFQ